MELINQLLNISEGDDLEAETVNQAKSLRRVSEEYWNSCMWSYNNPWRYYKLCSNSNYQRFRFICNSV